MSNSIDSELEEILDFYRRMFGIKDKDFNTQLLGAIKSKYISRKEVEEAIEQYHETTIKDLEFTKRWNSFNPDELIRKSDTRAKQLRAKLLPPTNTGEKE